MYLLHVINDFFRLKTPHYTGRSWLQARVEAVEYSFLYLFLAEGAKFLDFSRPRAEWPELVSHWGRLTILVDDIQDQSHLLNNKELGEILFEDAVPTQLDGIVRELYESLTVVKKAVAQTKHEAEFFKLAMMSFEAQQSTENSPAADVLKQSEVKGGAFLAAFLLLFNPYKLDAAQERAVFVAGSWLQALDDYADRKQDIRDGIKTFFTESDESKKDLKILSRRYEAEIKSLLERDDCLIPLLRWMGRWVMYIR